MAKRDSGGGCGEGLVLAVWFVLWVAERWRTRWPWAALVAWVLLEAALLGDRLWNG